MKNFQRTTLMRENLFGIDSIQGFLEMAHWYNKREAIFVCDKKDKNNHGSMLFILNLLEKEGNINIEWSVPEKSDTDNRDMLELKQISLTVRGYKLLDELNQKSKLGSLKKRAVDLIWIILTTICTTLVVLKLKGL